MAGITPKGTPDYEKEVQKLLKQIAGNPAGQVIIGAINGTKKDLTLKPFSEWGGGGEKHCRAISWPESRATSAPKGTGGNRTDLRGKWYLGKSDDEDTEDHDERFDAAGPSKVAAGGGSNALLYFTPGEWGKSGCFNGVNGSMPDEVLAHELVHALRIMQGLFNQVPTVNPRYENEEEFLAIVAANVYISAKYNDNTHLVADHVSHDRLRPPLNTSKGFVDDRDNSRLLSEHLFAWRPVFASLAGLQTPKFNPFREALSRL